MIDVESVEPVITAVMRVPAFVGHAHFVESERFGVGREDGEVDAGIVAVSLICA